MQRNLVLLVINVLSQQKRYFGCSAFCVSKLLVPPFWHSYSCVDSHFKAVQLQYFSKASHSKSRSAFIELCLEQGSLCVHHLFRIVYRGQEIFLLCNFLYLCKWSYPCLLELVQMLLNCVLVIKICLQQVVTTRNAICTIVWLPLIYLLCLNTFEIDIKVTNIHICCSVFQLDLYAFQVCSTRAYALVQGFPIS